MTETKRRLPADGISPWIDGQYPAKLFPNQRGRQYRRCQYVKHSDRLLFLIQHLRYAPHIGYINGGHDGKTLLHTGKYIQYPKSSATQQFLKKKTNRARRKYVGLPPKGNQYRKLVEYWWVLY